MSPVNVVCVCVCVCYTGLTHCVLTWKHEAGDNTGSLDSLVSVTVIQKCREP